MFVEVPVPRQNGTMASPSLLVALHPLTDQNTAKQRACAFVLSVDKMMLHSSVSEKTFFIGSSTTQTARESKHIFQIAF